MNVRIIRPGDAARLLDLQTALDHESRFMLLEPGERPAVPDGLHDRLARQERGPSFTFAAVEDEGLICGYVEVSVLPFARALGKGHVVMGVRASHAGRGVGRALLDAAIEHARERGMRRLELTVMTHNRAALNLYLGRGFVVEGLRREALAVDGHPVDEYYMGLLLSAPAAHG